MDKNHQMVKENVLWYKQVFTKCYLMQIVLQTSATFNEL